MDQHPRNQNRYRSENRPRYFKSNRSGGYSNQYQRHQNQGEGSINPDIGMDSTSENTAPFSREYEKNSARNFNSDALHYESSRPVSRPKSRFENSPHSRVPPRTDRSTTDKSFRAQSSSVTEPELTAEQRGKIIGGRYIRRHSNQPHAPHSHSSSHEAAEYEENLSNHSHSGVYKNSYASTEHHKRQNRAYPMNNNHKHYSHHNMASEERPSLVNSRRYNENVSSATDVYRYSTQNVDDKKSHKYKEFINHKTHLSSVSSTFHENEATQRELLIEQLNKGDCECLVCCEQIRVKDQTWHCVSCYHVFHLRCIRKWARSPAATVEDGEWRCPACQSLTSKIPYDYFCFCGKQRDPGVNYHFTPHSCGDICDRKRLDCSHKCKELCHPGPCPPCVVVVQKSCACGKTFKTTTCKQTSEQTCNSVCGKTLNCGVHLCKSKCHPGECSTCEEKVLQNCYCRNNHQTVPCTSQSATVPEYSCGSVCAKQLKCGYHSCETICHPGACSPCSLSTTVIKYCPCGKASIKDLVSSGKANDRKSCKDPIPVCGEKCEKILSCGPKDAPHKCQSICHHGSCPPCPLSTSMKCRCGGFTKEFSCKDITPAFVYTCEKRCNKRKDCGRHKCLNNCCIYIEHRCNLVCNKKLTCGLHLCQETCHMANCPTCWNVSFDELRCHCGESVLYPPIHCGTKPPECSKPCIRAHPCDHEVKHTCHSDEKCPPCTSLTAKWCYGHHKQCGSIMCFLEGVSCGMMCLKDLPCGNHKCKLTCHSGQCLKEDAKCTQACTTPRLICGHPCGNQCHTGSCPENPCKAQVTMSCPCGHRSETTTCYDSTKSYRLMSVSVLASKMQEIKDGQSVNLNDVLGRKSKNSKLQCNEECAVIERNKRLAVALQIQNPELSTSLGPPNYSEFVKGEGKKNPTLVAEIYDKISDLVQLAKESKQKCRSHSFPPMNRDHRRVVHELAEFFGCETQSYDEEPKKNVVVTAYKTKCWLPFVSIMTVVQRDMGFRKGPTPVLVQRESKSTSGNNATTATPQKKKIDYFDYNE